MPSTVFHGNSERVYCWNTYTISAWVNLNAPPGGFGILGTRFGGDNTFDVKVTGTGFRHLQGMKQLESINLHSAPASDAGLEAIGKLTSLRRLEIVHTKVTDAGVSFNYTTVLNIAFLVLAAVLLARYFRKGGGVPMLRMMNEAHGEPA